MKEIERIIDRRYTILTLAILEQAYKDATQTRKPMLAREAKCWISQNVWGLITLLDLPITEKEYLRWLAEIDPKEKGMLPNDNGKRENITQTKKDNRSTDHMQDRCRSIRTGRNQQDYILQVDE